MVISDLPQEVQKTIEQIAASCPLRLLSKDDNGANGGENEQSQFNCTVSDFEVRADAEASGYSFICKNTKQSICAGFVNAAPEPEQAETEMQSESLHD